MEYETDINWSSLSDSAISETIGEFIKHHRINQNKTQGELATAAGISRSTLSLLERGESVTIATFIKVLRVLDQLYLMNSLQIKTQQSPIELAKLESKKRQRVSAKTSKEKPGSKW
jgi:transcriptional regulator with XRE-family HTH domain